MHSRTPLLPVHTVKPYSRRLASASREGTVSARTGQANLSRTA